MPEYFVRTNSDRVICIEADDCLIDRLSGVYTFRKDEKPVASFNYHAVLAIMQESAFQGEFSAIDDEDDSDDVCLDCRLQDFLKSEDFFGEVWDIVEAWHAPDEDTPPEAEEPEPYPIEHWKKGGEDRWGFQTPKGFVDFYEKGEAEEGRKTQIERPQITWAYLDLTGYTKVED